MKILSLQFSNLNSLKGEWKIDFNHPPFTDNGLFAITGHTGAGKTTILDAICLALYHQTPRLGQITVNNNEIMTRGCADCSAEVIFEVKQARYRAFWSMRRSRGKADGKLQAAIVELASMPMQNASDDEQEDTIITTKITHKCDEIKKITGLDFSRFTKSMMLSQGQFAAFLNAKENDRADLLEELTGSEIYGQISEKVHEYYAQAKQKQAELNAKAQGVSLLPAEEKSALKQNLKQIELQQKQNKEQVSLYDTQLNILTQEKQIQQQESEAKNLLTQAQQDKTDKSADLQRLEDAIPAENLRAPLQLLEHCQQQITTYQTQHKEIQITKDQLKQKLSLSQQTLSQSQQQLKQEKQAQQTLELLLTEKVMPLDAEMANKQNLISDQEQQQTKLNKQYHDIQIQIQNLHHEHAQLQNNEIQVTQYLEQNQADQHLLEHLGQWQLLHQQNQQYQAALKQSIEKQQQHKQIQEKAKQQQVSSQQALIQAQTQWQQEQATLAAAQQNLCNLLAQDSIDSLEQQQVQYHQNQLGYLQLNELQQQYSKANEDLLKQNQLLHSKSQELETKQKQLTHLDQQLDKENRLLESYQAMLSQEEHLAHYRAQLQDHQACPLCGSTEHDKNVLSVDISQTQNNITQAQNEVSSLLNQQQDCSQQIESLKRHITELEYKLQNLYAQQQDLKQQWRLQCQTQNLDLNIEQQAQFTQFQQLQESNFLLLKQHLSTVKAADKQVHLYQTQVNQSQLHYENLNTQQKLLSQELENNEQQTLNIKYEIEQLNQEQTKLSNNFEQAVAATGLSLDTSNIESWLNKKSQDSQQWQYNKEQQNQLRLALTRLNTEKSNLQHNAESLLEEQKLALSVLDNNKAQAKILAEERFTLFADKNVQNERQLKQQALQLSEQNHQQAQALEQELTINYQQSCAELSNLESQITQVNLEQEKYQNELNTGLELSPFSEQSQLKAALLPQHEKQELEQLKQRLNKAIEQNTALLENALKQKNELESHINNLKQTQNWQPLEQDELIELQHKIKNELETKAQLYGEISQQLSNDEKQAQQQQNLFKEIEEYSHYFTEIQHLHSLIGSQSGDKFRKFAQGLTLDNLIYLANKQLQNLHGRYELKRKQSEGLELSVLDTWQGDIARDTKTLSGGESFLVSLALALALSDLVSHKTSIDSLFLDEGFGTLDNETLDIALDALDNLNASGKMIGVISHIDAMKERIPTQIKVKKMSGLGISELASQYKVSRI